MKTLFIIAWRNCWRNKLRSLIVISAIFLGIWSSIFLMGFSKGFVNQRVDKMVQLQIGDIQIHSKTFDFDNDISNTIQNKEALLINLNANTSVEIYSERFISEASAVTAHGQNGIKIIGVNPENETKVLGLSTRMSEGTFLDSKLAYPIVVGEKLAEELHLKLNSKVQLNFTNPNTSQISKTFKVCGIYNIGDDVFEGYNVFVPLSKIEKLTGEHLIHEIVIKTSEDPNSTAIALQAQNPSHQIQSWGKRNPEIAYMIEMMDTTLFILMSIIVFALLFGIINTLTMSILERKREIGVMLAIGMNKYRIRGMIMFESLIYGLIGAPVGVFLGYLTMMYYGNYGFDLSAFGEGMKAFGYDPILYLSLENKYYVIYTIYILVATFIGGLYPSRIATRLNPIEAIRAI
ncbi:MAG: ABC transporter permease [Bacteroidetes bacterium]|nr:ABC transporter permease [Bacteroidota bacterium]